MNSFLGVLLALAVLLQPSSLERANEKKAVPPAADQTFVSVDFAPVGQLPGFGERRIYLEIEAADGTKTTSGPRFEIIGTPGFVAATLCVHVRVRLRNLAGRSFGREDGWCSEIKGDRMVVTALKDKDGRLIPIKSIRVSSDGTFPIEWVPTVIASENVTVIRDTDPREKKK